MELDKNSQLQAGCWHCHCANKGGLRPGLQTPCSSNTGPRMLRPGSQGQRCPRDAGRQRGLGWWLSWSLGGWQGSPSREVPLARSQPCPWCFNQDKLTPDGSLYLARCGWGKRMGIAAVGSWVGPIRWVSWAVTLLRLPPQACHLRFGSLGPWPGNEPQCPHL